MIVFQSVDVRQQQLCGSRAPDGASGRGLPAAGRDHARVESVHRALGEYQVTTSG